MPELRQDSITRQWVAIATERARRPHTFSQAPKTTTSVIPTCPFCEGHETETPPEVMAYRTPGTHPDSPGWQLRVVPNLYPAFGPAYGQVVRKRLGLYTTARGLGVHEVLVHSPDHWHDLGSLAVEQVDLAVKGYIDRYRAHRNNPVVKYILIIVNHGREAGASREHPHAQLFGIPLVPEQMAREISGTEAYRRREGRCIYCDIAASERDAGQRVILESSGFLSFAPYASRVPFESWILPKAHRPRFEAMEEAERQEFASMLRALLARLLRGLGDPPFNSYIHTTPCQDKRASYHWHLEVIPKLSIAAGFELGSGIMINTATPEDAAAFLRSVKEEDS